MQKLVSALGPDSQNNSTKHVRIVHLACRTFFVCVRLKNAKISHVSMQQEKCTLFFNYPLFNATTSSSGTINIWLKSWQTPWMFIVVTYILLKARVQFNSQACTTRPREAREGKSKRKTWEQGWDWVIRPPTVFSLGLPKQKKTMD